MCIPKQEELQYLKDNNAWGLQIAYEEKYKQFPPPFNLEDFKSAEYYIDFLKAELRRGPQPYNIENLPNPYEDGESDEECIEFLKKAFAKK